MRCETYDGDRQCWRLADHTGTSHRFTPTKALMQELAASATAERLAHLSQTDHIKIGRFTIKSGDPVRLDRKQERVKAEWCGWTGTFQRLVTNAKTGKTHAEVVGGKKGKERRLSAVPVSALVYTRPKRTGRQASTSDKEA